MHCSKALAVLGGVIALLWGGGGWAYLETGTLLTNAATATYGAGGQRNTISYSATAKILVANPSVYLWKEASPTSVMLAGGTIDFVICFSNGGANTAWNVTIRDKLPNNTFYISRGTAWCSDATAGVKTVQYATTAQPEGNWSAGGDWNTTGNWPTSGQGQPVWLRWILPALGVGKSGCVYFTISVG